MSNTAPRSANVTFFTVEEFKAKLNLSNEKAQVIRNPNADANGVKKLFLAIGTSRFKCQQDIDGSKEMKMLVDNGNLQEACLTNVKETQDNVVFSL
jgi:hypothetical protein